MLHAIKSQVSQERQKVLIIAPESSGLENTAKAKTALRDTLKRPRLQCASHALQTSQSGIHLVQTKKKQHLIW
jgi:hypothetical protein